MFPCAMFPCNGGFPRKVGSSWEIFAPAKLNLYLEVLGPRADGFHALETLMVPVRIYDQLLWHDCNDSATGGPLTLRVRNLLPAGGNADPLLSNFNDNLVLRAARLLAEVAGVEPRGRFDLIKRIPIQAGMGGGSSDAAAALLLANQAWGIGYSYEQLHPLATQLGSDVPFFLNHGAAICRGRGELVEPVARLPRLHFVVAKPPAGLSTAEVFGQLPARQEADSELAAASRSRLSQLITLLQSGDFFAACQLMSNRLESAAARMAPWLLQLRETFSSMGCLAHLMTGSGSSYVGVMRSATQARCVAQRLDSMNLGNAFATAS